ncbi:MAG: dephospho-CoA kinase [Deltaproteobacteria bacterium]|nr:dephospho-CoA kinase [Deltaproteobacteria bacterium]
MPNDEQTRIVPVIGLTGGIAAGKTTVSRMLARQGAHVIDADKLGHEAIAPAGIAYPEIIVRFGTGILNDDGTISRPKLANIVFSDAEALRVLNSISHPLIAGQMKREINRVRARATGDSTPCILLDAAILFETGWNSLCDVTWAVHSTPERARDRLIVRNKMSPEDADARMAAQMNNEQRAAKVDSVIYNDGTFEELETQVRNLWEKVISISWKKPAK